MRNKTRESLGSKFTSPDRAELVYPRRMPLSSCSYTSLLVGDLGIHAILPVALETVWKTSRGSPKSPLKIKFTLAHQRGPPIDRR